MLRGEEAAILKTAHHPSLRIKSGHLTALAWEEHSEPGHIYGTFEILTGPDDRKLPPSSSALFSLLPPTYWNTAHTLKNKGSC